MTTESFTGAGPAQSSTAGNVSNTGGAGVPDHRARLHAKPGQKDFIYGRPIKSNLMYQLHGDASGSPHGMIFPYTPNITYQQNVEYTPYDLTHVNQEPHAYTKTQALQLQVFGDFTAQNAWEARYMLGCIHFLRSVSKMHFGRPNDYPGAPPPVILFSAYGNLMFDRLPVVVTNFSVNLTNDTDYVKVPMDNNLALTSLANATGTNRENFIRTYGSKNEAWVPAKTTLTVSILYQKPPLEWAREFDLKQFKSGQLLRNGRGGWI